MGAGNFLSKILIPDFHPRRLGATVKNSSGFTLLEVLVVVAILGVLAVLLSPALSRMLAKGRQATCVANLRNLATASQQFFADNSSAFFSRAYSTDLQPYLERQDSWWTQSLWKNAGVSCPVVNAMRGAKFNSGIYGVNYVFINEIGGPIPGQPPSTWPLRTINVEKPAKAWLFSEAGRCLADGSANVDPLSYLTPGNLAVEPKPGVASLIWPHESGRKNFAFLDGHVESLNWTEVNAFNGKPSNSREYKEFHGMRE